MPTTRDALGRFIKGQLNQSPRNTSGHDQLQATADRNEKLMGTAQDQSSRRRKRVHRNSKKATAAKKRQIVEDVATVVNRAPTLAERMGQEPAPLHRRYPEITNDQ